MSLTIAKLEANEMKRKVAYGFALAQAFDKKCKAGMIEIEAEMDERIKGYAEHRGFGHRGSGIAEPSRQPSRQDIPVTEIEYDEAGTMKLMPTQSQGVNLTTANDDRATNGATIIRPLAPGACMPKPRMTRRKDGIIITEDVQE